MGYFLLDAAKSHSYIETLGDHADSLHKWIKSSYQEDFEEALLQEVKKALPHLSLSIASIAIDFTHEPFYGKTRGLYIFNAPPKESYSGKFVYITISVITRNKAIPFMALPVLVGEGVARKTIILLELAQKLFKRIRYAVFDRGFYVSELIDYLESRTMRYLILVPEKGEVISGYIDETDELGRFRHQMEYAKKKSKWRPKTTIVVCKGMDDFPWIFATNITFRTRAEYLWCYKRRWQIETNYRVEDEARIKSKSTHYLIRYFYFLMALVLHILWTVNKHSKYYVPFKRYLAIVQQNLLMDYLELSRM
jgi:hypothetical protein